MLVQLMLIFVWQWPWQKPDLYHRIIRLYNVFMQNFEIWLRLCHGRLLDARSRTERLTRDLAN